MPMHQGHPGFNSFAFDFTATTPPLYVHTEDKGIVKFIRRV
jgi:hypothetical protein